MSCGGSGDGGSKKLTWFVAIQPGGSFEKIAADCTKQSGGKYEVELEPLPTDADPQREQLVRRLGAEDSTVDIIGMDVIWTAEFANAGWLRPFTDEERAAVTESVFPSAIETASFEGKLYGAPLNSNTQLLWYRKDLVPKPPQTWDEMIDVAEKLPEAGTIQVQALRFEGYTAWATALIESAGGEVLSGPETVALQRTPTEQALEVIGKLANSSAASPSISTADEDISRLAFEAGDSAFMVNYTFAYGSAVAEAPDIAKKMGFAPYPRVDASKPSRPPLGGFNLGVSSFSKEPELAFEAAKCLSGPESQLAATELDGLPPSRRDLYTDKVVTEAYPGFAPLVKSSIAAAGPRPLSPAYQDVTLAIQRALHPPEKITAGDVGSVYEELKSKVEEAVKREGLL